MYAGRGGEGGLEGRKAGRGEGGQERLRPLT